MNKKAKLGFSVKRQREDEPTWEVFPNKYPLTVGRPFFEQRPPICCLEQSVFPLGLSQAEGLRLDIENKEEEPTDVKEERRKFIKEAKVILKEMEDWPEWKKNYDSKPIKIYNE